MAPIEPSYDPSHAHSGWVVDGHPVVPLKRAMDAEAEVERLREIIATAARLTSEETVARVLGDA